MKTKFLVTIEFRYLDSKDADMSGTARTKTITIGIYDDIQDAYQHGNQALEVLESKFPLNPNYNKRERFSANGGPFGFPNHLITDLAYLRTPFSFFAKVTKLEFGDISDTIDEVMAAKARYDDYVNSQNL